MREIYAKYDLEIVKVEYHSIYGLSLHLNNAFIHWGFDLVEEEKVLVVVNY